MDNGASSYRRFLSGDESGFDEILNLYQDNLIFFINRYVHNVTVAEDLAADTFVELLAHKHRYNFKTALKTYLFMMGRSNALDYLKRENIRHAVPFTDAADAAFEDRLITDENKRILNSAINNLHQDYKTALHLVYFEDMTYDEAARVMKKNVKQISNLIHRAKNALRSHLGKDGFSL